VGLALRDLRECCVLAQLKTAETRCFPRIISGNGAEWQTRDCGDHFFVGIRESDRCCYGGLAEAVYCGAGADWDSPCGAFRVF
jgi:hypothetical protein